MLAITPDDSKGERTVLLNQSCNSVTFNEESLRLGDGHDGVAESVLPEYGRQSGHLARFYHLEIEVAAVAAFDILP